MEEISLHGDSTTGSIRSQLNVVSKPVQGLKFSKKLCGFTFNFDDQMQGELYRSRVNLYKGADYKVPTNQQQADTYPENPSKDNSAAGKTTKRSKGSVVAALENGSDPTMVPGAGHLAGVGHGGGLNEGIEEGSDCADDDASHFSIESRESAFSDKQNEIDGSTVIDDTTIYTHGSVESDINMEELTSRQRMALTLKKWSAIEENHDLIANEGIVDALHLLTQSEDITTRRYCINAYASLSQNVKVRNDMFVSGAASIIAQIALGQNKDQRVGLSCSKIIYDLSQIPSAGERLAEEGVVVALCLLLGFNHPQIWTNTSYALYNLTCVKNSYVGLDRILKALMTLYDTAYQAADPSFILVKASTNLSCIYRMRGRLVDEGIIDRAIQQIIPVVDLKTKYQLAITLHNIATSRAFRMDLVNKGVMELLFHLVNSKVSTEKNDNHTLVKGIQNNNQDEDEEKKLLQDLLEIISITIQRLAIEPMTRKRALEDGIVRVISNIIEKSNGSEKATQACSDTLHSFTIDSNAEVIQAFIKNNGHMQISILVNITDDLKTQLSCISAICNILTLEKFHETAITSGLLSTTLSMASKVVETLSSISQDRNSSHYQYCLLIAEVVSVTLQSFSSSKVQEGFISAGGVNSLVSLVQCTSIRPILRRCASAFANLSYDNKFATPMIECGSLTALSTLLLSPHIDILSLTLLAVAHLAHSRNVSKEMIKAGIIEALLKSLKNQEAAVFDREAVETKVIGNARLGLEEGLGSGSGPLTQEEQEEYKEQEVASLQAEFDQKVRESKQSVCAILASLSFDNTAIQRLVELGVIDHLFVLARTDHTASRKRCATALCNISYLEDIRIPMIKKGIVNLLSYLSNTYSDETQMDCASCFNNLSCVSSSASDEEEGSLQEIMIREGALGALLMIALVRAVTTQTKEICARAIFNLVTPQTLEYCLEEGVVQSMASLCNINTEGSLKTCAQAFVVFVSNMKAREILTGKRSLMNSYMSLIRSNSLSTKRMVTRAVCILLQYEASRLPANSVGAFNILRCGAALGSAECGVEISRTIILCSTDPSCQQSMIRENIPLALTLLANSPSRDVVNGAIKALAVLCAYPNLREYLIKADILQLIVMKALSKNEASIVDGEVPNDVSLYAEECLRIAYYFSINKNTRTKLLHDNVIMAMIVLTRTVIAENKLTPTIALTISAAIERLSWNNECQTVLLEYGGLNLLVDLIALLSKTPAKDLSPEKKYFLLHVTRNACMTFATFAKLNQNIAKKLLTIGAVTVIAKFLELYNLRMEGKQEEKMRSDVFPFTNPLTGKIIEDTNEEDQSTLDSSWRIALCIRNFTDYKDLHNLIDKVNLIPALVTLAMTCKEGVARQYCASSICALSKTKDLQSKLVAMDAVQALMILSKDINKVTQETCSVAIANLSNDTKLSTGAVDNLVQLLKSEEKKIADDVKPQAGSKKKNIASIRNKFKSASFAARMFNSQGDTAVYDEGLQEIDSPEIQAQNLQIGYLASSDQMKENIDTTTILELDPEPPAAFASTDIKPSSPIPIFEKVYKEANNNDKQSEWNTTMESIIDCELGMITDCPDFPPRTDIPNLSMNRKRSFLMQFPEKRDEIRSLLETPEEEKRSVNGQVPSKTRQMSQLSLESLSLNSSLQSYNANAQNQYLDDNIFFNDAIKEAKNQEIEDDASKSVNETKKEEKRSSLLKFKNQSDQEYHKIRKFNGPKGHLVTKRNTPSIDLDFEKQVAAAIEIDMELVEAAFRYIASLPK